MSKVSTRLQALSLYRRLLREGQLMPTPNRREFIRNKVRREFRASLLVKDPEEIAELLVFGEDALENVTAQRRHLNRQLLYEPDPKPSPAMAAFSAAKEKKS